MDNGTFIIAGLIVGIVAALGLGFALFGFVVSLRDSNRQRRLHSADEYNPMQAPTTFSLNENPSRLIVFGEAIDNNNDPKYSPDTYVVIQPGMATAGICLVCRQTVANGNDFTCPVCDARYHHDHFLEQNYCVNCGWRPA